MVSPMILGVVLYNQLLCKAEHCIDGVKGERCAYCTKGEYYEDENR